MLRMIGYWIETFDDPQFIAPQELVGKYPDDTRRRVIEYLEGGWLLRAYFGLSWCRFPGCWHRADSSPKHMGSSEFTDGVWAWPEGLVHYVARHDVQLPEEFIAHVLGNRAIPRSYDCEDLSDLPGSDEEPDHTYWIEYCARHGSGLVRRRMEELREQAARARARAKAKAEAACAARGRKLERQEGLSAERCQWQSCKRRAVKGRALCAGHLEREDRDMQLERAVYRVQWDFLLRSLTGGRWPRISRYWDQWTALLFRQR